jgi:hypothetical protein
MGYITHCLLFEGPNSVSNFGSSQQEPDCCIPLHSLSERPSHEETSARTLSFTTMEKFSESVVTFNTLKVKLVDIFCTLSTKSESSRVIIRTSSPSVIFTLSAGINAHQKSELPEGQRGAMEGIGDLAVERSGKSLGLSEERRAQIMQRLLAEREARQISGQTASTSAERHERVAQLLRERRAQGGCSRVSVEG